jgi:hypothetical protein
MADIDYKAKIADGSITVREAFEAVLAKKLTESNRTVISGLLKSLPDEGIDLDAPYFDVYKTESFAKALDFTTNTSGVHKYKEFGAFETQLEGLIRGSGRDASYNRLSDSNKRKGIASDEFGLTGTQLRNKDPMRGTIPSDSLDKIYQDALDVESFTEVDVRRGIDKPMAIDSEARDYLIYEKYTGQRVESNIGPDGLKISDINFFEDENGNIVAEVREKKVGNKTRPEVTYRGEFAEFLRNKVEQAKNRVGPTADLTKANLFDTTSTAVDKLWNTRIRPELEAQFPNQLPAGKGGSHSVIRKILARQLIAEFNFPADAVRAWMGHAGVGINASGDILMESYVGTVADDRIGEMTNVLIRNDARNSGSVSVNDMMATRGVQFDTTFTFPAPNKKIVATDVNLLQPQLTALPMTEGERELIGATAEEKAVEKQIATEERRAYLSKIRSERQVSQADIQAGFQEAEKKSVSKLDFLPEEVKDDLKRRGIWDTLKGAGKTTLKAAPLAGAGLAYQGYREAGASVPGAILGAALEETPLGLGVMAEDVGFVSPAGETEAEMRELEVAQDPERMAGPYSGQDFIPAQEEPVDESLDVIKRDVEMGTVDAVPEAPIPSPQENQGFLSPTL